MVVISSRLIALLLWICGFCAVCIYGKGYEGEPDESSATLSTADAVNNNNPHTNTTKRTTTAETTTDTNDKDEDESEDVEIFEIEEGDEEDIVHEEFIELNPSYVGPPEDIPYDDDSDDSEADNAAEGEGDQAMAKKQLNKAVASNATKTTKGRIRRAGKKTLRFIRKHRGSITVVAFLYAFRKEIKHFFGKVFTTPVTDPRTGETYRRLNRFTATDALKLIVFLDIMRRLLSNKPSDESPSTGASQVSATLLLLLLKGGMLGPGSLFLLPLLLSKPEKSVYLPPVKQHYTFETINHRFTKDGMALQRALGGSNTQSVSKTPGNFSSYKSLLSSLQAPSTQKESETSKPTYNGTMILLDMTQLDVSVSQIGVIRDKVSFILREYSSLQSKNSSLLPDDGKIEVTVLLESPGGSAPDYALAAQQLLRLRNHPNITVTVLVDKVAASGGYMIACTSSPGNLFAAPFAILGSIGVVGQAVNIQKTLESYGVQTLVFRGGRDKAPLGLLGEITEEGIEKVQQMVETAHRAFKRHVVEARPILANNIEEVSTGDTFLGYDALDVGLVDGIISSDEYIGQRISDGALVLKLLQMKRQHKSLFKPSTEGEDFSSSLPVILGGGTRSLSTFLGHTIRLLQRAQSMADHVASFGSTNGNSGKIV